MGASALEQRCFIAGEVFDLWENPEKPFGCATVDLLRYVLRGEWELLLVLPLPTLADSV